MTRTAILTDSTADLTPDAAAAAGIRVVPLFVRFGAEELVAGVDISTERFWERMLAPGAETPTTAAPTPVGFRTAYDAAFADGADAIVCLTIASTMSATYQSAVLAAQALPDREIHVVDTETTTGSLGIAALLAAELAATGMPAEEVAATVRARLADIDIYVAIDTLTYLRRGGRMSAAQAAVGTVLSVKPIITIRDGTVVAAERQRTRGRARDRVIELITAQPIERVLVLHTPTSAAEEVAAFRDSIVARAPGGIDPERVTAALIGPSTGPHLGPDLMGAACLRRR